jgi:hypothetical protein
MNWVTGGKYRMLVPKSLIEPVVLAGLWVFDVKSVPKCVVVNMQFIRGDSYNGTYVTES